MGQTVNAAGSWARFFIADFPDAGSHRAERLNAKGQILKVFLAFSFWPFSPTSPPNRAGENVTIPGLSRFQPVRPVTFGVCLGSGPFFRKLARNKLLPDFMDTMTWQTLAGFLIFAAGNVAYFEIRRLIRFLRTHFNESKRCETTGINPFPGTAAANVPK
jgi:hypothetical protein